jgi:hypothetical protein
MNVELISLTFQGYEWAHVSAAIAGVYYVFSFMFIEILVAIS